MVKLNKYKNIYIYQGYLLKDFIFKGFNYILPGVNFYEIRGIFFNIFGKKQETAVIQKSPGNSLSDNVIFLSMFVRFSIIVNNSYKLFYNTFNDCLKLKFNGCIWFNKIYSLLLVNQNGIMKMEVISRILLFSNFFISLNCFLLKHYFILTVYENFLLVNGQNVALTFIWNYFLTSNITEMSKICNEVV